MKAKLIKTIDEQGVMYSLSGDNLPENYVLSLKNCQAIELGYDLDELVKEQYPIDEPSFKRGFKLALEILGDKKFSEKKMLEFGLYVWKNIDGERTMNQLFSDYKATQQTECDCIVEMDTDCTGEFKYFLLDKGKPKLDAENCLILKRKT